MPSGRARQLLAELAQASLLLEYAPGRYSLHDLLRAYAAELTAGLEDDQQRQAALLRVFDYYLHTAHRAAALLHPHRDLIAIVPAQSWVITEHLADTRAALTWFTAEQRTLPAVNACALQLGFDSHAWQLAWAMGEFLAGSGRWTDHQAVHRNALCAAERAGHKYATGYIHRALGLANARLGHRDDAHRHYERALHVCGEFGDHAGQGLTHLNLAYFYDADGNDTDALWHSQQAHDHFQAAGQPVGQAGALNNIGWFHAKLGDYERALFRCQQALATLQELDDALGIAATMDSLGYIHRQLGDLHQAIVCYKQAGDSYREVGEFQSEAEELTFLGDLYEDLGDADAARSAWRKAFDILSRLGHPGAEQVRGKLTSGRTAMRS